MPTSRTGRSTTTSSSRIYAEAERVIGVAGDHTGNPFAAWRSGPYPMPPGADMFLTTLTVPAAEALGYHPYRAPTGANSVPYDGRPACNNCGFCAFYGCPIEAKGDPIAPLRRALRTGRCEVRPESVAVEILLDAGTGRGRGVRYFDADGDAQTVDRRRPSSSRAARSRRRDCCCAAASATRPTSSAAT